MSVEPSDASLQEWEIPPPGALENMVQAARSSRRWTRVATPRTGFAALPESALTLGDAAHRAARELITPRARKARIQLRRSFFQQAQGSASVAPAHDKPVAYRIGSNSVTTYLALLWLASGEGLPADDTRVADDPYFVERRSDMKHEPLTDDWGPRLCAFDPHTVQLSANTLGLVLGAGPTRRARTEKVRRAMKDLASDEVRLIRRRASPGPMISVQLLHDSGSQRPYRRPRVIDGRTAPGDPYIPVPVTLFTQGWVPVLSPRAILAYLLILSQQGLRASSQRLGATLRRRALPMSDDRFHAGRGELAWWGLVQLTGGAEKADVPAAEGELFHRIVYNRPVEGATAVRPREIYRALVQANLATP